MWDVKILGVEFYYIANWFYIYSFLGWLWESCFVSITNKKVVNRGFITGPLCTIYGVGGVTIYVLLRPFSDNIFLIYIGGVLLASLLEYITAAIMEGIFHTSWWDYSKNRFNIKGRICLSVSLGWGIFTVVLFKVLQPFVSYLTNLYPVRVGEIAVIVITILYLIDFTNSTIASLKLSKKLTSFDDMMNDLAEYFQSTKIYEAGEELKEKLEQYKNMSIWKPKKEGRMSKFNLKTRLNDMESFRRREIEAKLAEYNEKISKLSQKMGFVAKRYIRSYPKLDGLSGLHRDKKNQQEENQQAATKEKE